MGVLGNLFKPKGDTIKGTVEAVGTVAKDIRQAITGDDPVLNQKLVDSAVRLEEIASSIVTTEMKGNWLQRSWRPILALVCIFVILMQYAIIPFASWIAAVRGLPVPPEGTFDAAALWPIISTLIAYRTVEKTTGVRDALGQK